MDNYDNEKDNSFNQNDYESSNNNIANEQNSMSGSDMGSYTNNNQNFSPYSVANTTQNYGYQSMNPNGVYNQNHNQNQNPNPNPNPNQNPNQNTSSLDSLKSAPFYTEKHKKKEHKKRGLGQLVAVSVVSSIIGALVIGILITFVAPEIQPAIKNLFSNTTTAQNSTSKPVDTSAYRKVELITSSDTPVTAIAKKVGPSVVGVRTTFKAQDFLFGDQSEAGEGSGVIVRDNGYILTNNHVIKEAIDVTTGKIASGAKIEVFLPNNPEKPYTAALVGFDSKTDLAILKINENNLPAVEFGDSSKINVGELAVAIGNPGGMDLAGTVTVGVVSGINREVPTEDGKIINLIQTDAAINPGNSGGALVNSKGQIIGINELKVAANGFEGLGFAIPSNEAKDIADKLIDHGYVTGRPLLGISPDPRYTEQVAKANNMPVGVYVKEVDLMSGAQKAGIKTGDIITKIDGKAIKNRDELDEVKNTHKVGDKVVLEIYRDGKTMNVNVVLTENKSNN